jgi:hypothetical protein
MIDSEHARSFQRMSIGSVNGCSNRNCRVVVVFEFSLAAFPIVSMHPSTHIQIQSKQCHLVPLLYTRQWNQLPPVNKFAGEPLSVIAFVFARFEWSRR